MGTVTKRGKSYRIRIYDGYDINGKQIERTLTYTPPPELSAKAAEKEAYRQMYQMEDRIRYGYSCNGRIRFCEFADLWFRNYAEPQLRAKTTARYRLLMIRINAAIGHLRLEKITPLHIMEFENSLRGTVAVNRSYIPTIDLRKELAERGITKVAFGAHSGVSQTTLSSVYTGKAISYACADKIATALHMPFNTIFRAGNEEKKLSATTIQHYHRLVSNILSAAVKWQYIPYNPCKHITPPKKGESDILYLDDVQAKEFLKYISQAPGYYRRPTILLLLTGLRRSELLGLEWRDIDWQAKTMRINRTSQCVAGKGTYTDTTKNKTSNRIVAISDQCIKILQEQYAWQLLQQNTLGNAWKGEGRIVVDEHGKAFNPDRYTHWFSKFMRKHPDPDYPRITLHSLRHTYATLCISKGIPLTAVAKQLGHANVSTTAKIYAHAIRSAQIAATDAVGDMFAELL